MIFRQQINITLLVHWIKIRECNRMLDSLISVLLRDVLAVIIDKEKRVCFDEFFYFFLTFAEWFVDALNYAKTKDTAFFRVVRAL